MYHRRFRQNPQAIDDSFESLLAKLEQTQQWVAEESTERARAMAAADEAREVRGSTRCLIWQVPIPPASYGKYRSHLPHMASAAPAARHGAQESRSSLFASDVRV